MMQEPVVMPHPLQGVIVEAMKVARAKGTNDALVLAAGVRAVLEAQPELGISEAYELVSRLWVR